MWFSTFIKSSIGKKWIMAATGLCLFFFLVSHAAGNATLFSSSELFQAYADQLHSHPLIVAVFSNSLLLIFLIHVITGLTLFFQNRQARPTRYRVTARAASNTLASGTMIYSGLCILLFIIIHIINFSLGNKGHQISETVTSLLARPTYSLFYIAAFLFLALHLSHGFWSMLQTFGINHPRYTALIAKLTLIVPLIFLALFGAIPVLIMSGVIT
ncbi:MAG: succinate dehydrogenase cytochrome b subunit [Desulfobulbaceae bacterium]|uniref:Succinate dehydrogenase cytochrome b subunit n=1 Tax=Candidatus Desulfatifera sulfidica TaxID=2841691 RepID=A0A8J6N9Q4_9BACT|nr:succinate dehydrogenase cytochrome b subunit [Candidatus Desulfatifera sulfidica]